MGNKKKKKTKKKKTKKKKTKKKKVGFDVPKSIGDSSGFSEEDGASHMSPPGEKITKLIQKSEAKAKTTPTSKSSSKTHHKPPPAHYPSGSLLSSSNLGISTSSDNWSLVSS